jgi:hypothetical protein
MMKARRNLFIGHLGTGSYHDSDAPMPVLVRWRASLEGQAGL